ncbi:MAG: bifunctional riboflavin kinase/FMN adenylyltransferase [Phycisphaerales bacterium]|jgi:riboflavin kinase/FMN adenylyltransferase|nr:bifunctional riboflavin kinase/FMN adenylyltransferase [Phycisphaerales bacterium]
MASALTIGTFDGVHLGHAALARRAGELARAAGGRAIALAFDPHPMALLAPERVPPRLSTFEERSRLLRGAGVDEVVRLEPTRELLGLDPEAFIAQLVERFAPVAIVEGRDFCFGKARAGDVNTLADLGRRFGFACEIVPPVNVALTDQSIVTASSTLTRWLLSHGRVRDLALVLGRHYRVSGDVVRGDRRGRTIGFPTCNIDPLVMLPADGVYAAWGTLPDGRRLPAAVSVGDKPTFGGSARTIEAYLIGAPRGAGDAIAGLDEYGWPLELDLVAWVREQARFASLDALLAQMQRDIERIEGVLADEAPEADSRRARPARSTAHA